MTSPIHSLLPRAALLVATGALALPGVAHAAATRLVDGSLIDATSDGRYVLYQAASGPRLLDRTAGTTVAVPAGAEQLADRSPRILIRDGDLYRVDDLTTGNITLATFDEQTNVVAATKAVLVRDGRSVVFETTSGGTRRTLERRLDTATTVERMTGAAFQDASEDGHVITWKRDLPPAQRPAGTTALPDDPPGGVPGTAVGYRIDDQAPRVLRTSEWGQGGVIGTYRGCENSRYATSTYTLDAATVQQDGAGGRYVFTVEGHSSNPYEPVGDQHVYERFTGAASRGVTAFRLSEDRFTLFSDPVSSASAWALQYVRPDGLSGAWGNLFTGDGAQTGIAIGGNEWQTSDRVGRILPIDRGAAVIADAAPGDAARGVYLAQGPAALGADQTSWLTLPRSTDPLDGPALRPDARYVICTPIGAPSDYVTVTRGAGRTATVTYTPAPAGKLAASTLTAKVTWFGITIWQRTFDGLRPGTFTTPALPAGVPGFRLAFTIRTVDGPATGTAIGL